MTVCLIQEIEFEDYLSCVDIIKDIGLLGQNFVYLTIMIEKGRHKGLE